MEGIEYYIDDMITLPGFVNRHLALMRELDQKAHEAQLKANELELEYFNLDISHNSSNVSDKGSNLSHGIHTSPNKFGSYNGKVILTPINNTKSDNNNSINESIHNNTNQTNNNESNVRSKAHTRMSNRSKSNSPTSRSNAKRTPVSREAILNLVDNIQKYRQESVLALREKITVNDQIMCMLKHENERMKHQFDIMYRIMERNGELPLEIKFKVENGIDLKDEYDVQNSGFSESENSKYSKNSSNKTPTKSQTSPNKHSRYMEFGNDYSGSSGYKKSYGENYDESWDGLCPVCNKGEEAQDEFGMVGCDSCNNWFHFHCVNYSNTCRDEPWFCPKCDTLR